MGAFSATSATLSAASSMGSVCTDASLVAGLEKRFRLRRMVGTSGRQDSAAFHVDVRSSSSAGGAEVSETTIGGFAEGGLMTLG